ncbi:MAG TPA: glycosyltransferase family 1 protein [Acidimicrobiales bacterium]|nr:glycosyltransferase family 1 protein [Acidimicrobiales bacterium]
MSEVSEREPLRVALDVLPLAGPPTGVGVCCDQLLRSLVARADVDVRAFAVARKAAGIRERLPPGVPFRPLAVPTRLLHGAWRYLGIPTADFVAGPVAVVHGTNFVVPPPRGVATVVTVNDVTPWKYPGLCAPATRSYPRLVQQAVRRGAFVHTASHQVAGELSELLGVRLESVRVIPYGVPPPVPPPGPALVEGPYVLAISTIEPRKDYPTLVKAFAALAGAHSGLRLVVAGAEGRGSAALDAAVAATGLADRVVRLGYVEDPVRSSLLAGARALAYPSLYEGFGFPPLEAMAAGVPVVATAGGAVPEVVGDGAVVVPVGDVAALAGALEQVLEDEVLRADLVRKGHAQVGRYSWAATAEAMVSLYFEAAAAAAHEAPARG